MTDYLDKNGIQVTPDKEKQIIVFQMFLNGKYETWVEFNKEQLDNLLFEIQTARKALGWKELTEWTENYGQGSEPWLKEEEK